MREELRHLVEGVDLWDERSAVSQFTARGTAFVAPEESVDAAR
jgi:hypothetical protein